MSDAETIAQLRAQVEEMGARLEAAKSQRNMAILALHNHMGEVTIRDGKPIVTPTYRVGDTTMLSIRQCRIIGLPDDYAGNFANAAPAKASVESPSLGSSPATDADNAYASRITPMLAVIEAAWRANPDMRLGQLIGNVLPDRCGNDPYHIEDDELLAQISECYGSPATDGTNG